MSDAAPTGGPSIDRELAARLREVTRYLLPFNAVVAVAGFETPPLELNGQTMRNYPNHGGRGDERDWTDLVAQLEALRGTAGFVLFPVTSLPWLERQPELNRYLDRQCRLALDEPGTCLVYALDPAADGAYPPPDRLPIPPRELVCLTNGSYDARTFYESGAVAVDYMTAILRWFGVEVGDLGAILDFGCGCGRVIRHWRQPRGATLSGTDYNPYLIRWCTEHLPGAEFQLNGLGPPLDYEDGSFDLVYAVSAFTHFDASLQLEWIDELSRVTRPGGSILLTVHGGAHLGRLSTEDRERFLAGELVVSEPDHAGTNLCAAYHPERYIRETMSRNLTVKQFVPNAAVDAQQDVVLLQKPLEASVEES